MKFQIIDVDYVNLNDKPVVRFFGKTEKGESVCVFYEGFKSYFYAAGKNVRGILKDDSEVITIETVEKNIVEFSKNLKLTVLWVTHYIEQAKRVSDRIANLKEGIVKEISNTKDFKWEGAY